MGRKTTAAPVEVEELQASDVSDSDDEKEGGGG